MTDSIVIFTFSPVQPFIAQARRAADLYSGSQILVELANAAATAMQTAGADLIYPASLDDDAPNRLVAKTTDVDACIAAAKASFDLKWTELCHTAFQKLSGPSLPIIDGDWQNIWERQTGRLWEIYWSSAEIKQEGFQAAYENARHALEAAKRIRAFEQSNEDGLKDSLSGERSSLRTKNADGREYWKTVSNSPKVTASKLKPDGRERLDAIGAIKRFGEVEEKKQIKPFNGFPSTSTIASLPYLRRARAKAPGLLKNCADQVKKLGCFEVRGDGVWRYDGDLFFSEILDPRRMKDDYHLELSKDELKPAQDALNELSGKIGRPSAYYAILALDGDGMGKRVNECQTVQEAKDLSASLTKFAKSVRKSMEFTGQGNDLEPQIYVIYNGGDDLLAMTSLENAFPAAQQFAVDFKKAVPDKTISAGIAIVHHQAPLSASLHTAREALEEAKQKGGKDAVCIRVDKRGSAPLELLSKWEDVGNRFTTLIEDFTALDENTPAPLSSKFAYAVLDEAQTVTALGSEARQSALNRLMKRHKQGETAPKTTAETLTAWTEKLDGYVPFLLGKDSAEVKQGMVVLGNWLVAARFIAQGGAE